METGTKGRRERLHQHLGRTMIPLIECESVCSLLGEKYTS